MEYPGSGGFGDPGIQTLVGTYPRGVRNGVFHGFHTLFGPPFGPLIWPEAHLGLPEPGPDTP